MSLAADERLYLDQWDDLTDHQQVEIARELATQLGDPYRFTSVEEFDMAGRTHRIARFEWQLDGSKSPVEFHLIPGAVGVALGHDPDEPLAVRCDAASGDTWNPFLHKWTDAQAGNRYPREVLARILTPPRTVDIAPILVERTAGRLRTGLAKDGFRMLTSDEWEWVCGAGERSVFRWGNEMPARAPAWHGVLPNDRDQADPAVIDAQIEMRPNAFGLQIAYDPYQWERVTEPNAMRGGDGGTSICGGDGLFAIWISLATAYIHRGVRKAATRRCRSLP